MKQIRHLLAGSPNHFLFHYGDDCRKTSDWVEADDTTDVICYKVLVQEWQPTQNGDFYRTCRDSKRTSSIDGTSTSRVVRTTRRLAQSLVPPRAVTGPACDRVRWHVQAPPTLAVAVCHSLPGGTRRRGQNVVSTHGNEAQRSTRWRPFFQGTSTLEHPQLVQPPPFAPRNTKVGTCVYTNSCRHTRNIRADIRVSRKEI